VTLKPRFAKTPFSDSAAYEMTRGNNAEARASKKQNFPMPTADADNPAYCQFLEPRLPPALQLHRNIYKN
jgi:hypothetical protein